MFTNFLKLGLVGSHLLDTFPANDPAAVMLDIVGIAAENTGRLVFLQNNFFPVYINFQRILNLDPQGPP
jgi:hypothetical protein